MADLSQLSDEELMALAGQPDTPTGMDLQGFTGFTNQIAKPRGVVDELGIADIGQGDVEQIMGVPSAPDFSKLSDEDLMKAAGIEIPVVDQTVPTQKDQLQAAFEEKKGFGDRVANNFQNRLSQGQASADRYVAGDQNAFRTGLQFAGKIGVGTGIDIANETVSAVTPQFLKDAGNGIINYLGDTAPGKLVASGANMAAQKYGSFAENNPALAADIESVANIGSVLPAARILSATAPAVTNAAKASVPVIQKGTERAVDSLATPKMIMPNSEQLAELGVKSYEAARKSGEVFDPKTVTNKFVGAIESAKPSKIGGTVETELSKDLESALGKYKELSGRPLSIDEVDIIDKDLGNLKDQAYSAGKNQFAGKLASIQNSLRGSVSESASGKTLAQATDFFRRKYQMEDVEKIFRNAEGRPNEAAIIQTGYRNLSNQARQKGSGYTKEQIKIMDKAAKGGLSLDALKLASSKLIPIAAGASGGPLGAGVAYMGNVAAAAGATALQTAKANKLARSITKGISVPAEPTAVNRLASRLKKPDIQQSFEAKKAEKQLLLAAPDKMPGVPMSDRQIAIAKLKLNKANKTIETPSVMYGSEEGSIPFPPVKETARVAPNRLEQAIEQAKRSASYNNQDSKNSLTSFLKKRGGIKASGDFKSQDMGAGKKGTQVGLFRKDGQGIDNIPASELRSMGFDDVIEDGNGYASSDWVFEKLQQEAGKKSLPSLAQDPTADNLNAHFQQLKLKKNEKISEVRRSVIKDTKQEVAKFGADITDKEAEILYMRVLDGEEFEDALIDMLERGNK